MSLQLMGVIGIAFIWILAICMTAVMKKIAPYMEGYPIYAAIVAILCTLAILLGISG